MDILSDVYNHIIHCPSVPPETGGIIGIKDGIVCDFLYDKGLYNSNNAIYTPDVERLNDQIRLWLKQNISFGGIVHSHPITQWELSSDDIKYIHTIFQSMPNTVRFLFFPIVLPNEKLLSFRAVRTRNIIDICKDEINIIFRSVEK